MLIAGGPSVRTMLHVARHRAAPEAVFCMNNSLQHWPVPDFYVCTDTMAVKKFLDWRMLAEQFGTRSFIGRHVDARYREGATIVDYDLSLMHGYTRGGRIIHGRTVGCIALQLAIRECKPSEVHLVGYDGYSQYSMDSHRNSQIEVKQAINTAAAIAYDEILAVHHREIGFFWYGESQVLNLMKRRHQVQQILPPTAPR